jgi:hypothetical protein
MENKMTFEDLNKDGETFEQESDVFSGEDMEVSIAITKVHFIVKGSDKKLKEKFKPGQDFEYVKYKLGGILEVDPEQIVK